MLTQKSNNRTAKTKRTSDSIRFPGVKGRKIEAVFSGQTITSDGSLLLRAADTLLGLTQKAGRCFADSRRKASCAHSIEAMLRQRVYALALGYEDLNDHDELRHDPALRAAAGRDVDMASASTLCRFENSVDARSLWALSSVLVDVFIQSHRQAPEEIILDFDATDDEVHGKQEGRFSTATMTITVFCRCMFFAASRCLPPIFSQHIDGAKHARLALSAYSISK